jgi:CYTH domain-containing protein
MEIELERTFLLKYIPEGLGNCEFRNILDIYIPLNATHPVLRIRKRGDIFEITKKEVIDKNDSSEQKENTIPLSQEEWQELAQISGKRLNKNRFFYLYDNSMAEIDIFLDDLGGLIVVDFEFGSRMEMESFKMPDFCLVEVTQDKALAGGILAGKKYEDIEEILGAYNYKKIKYELGNIATK